jgi:hypothetical protein
MALPVFARGVTRQIILATETNFGVQAAGPGQQLRRTSFTMDNQPPEIASTEISQDAQMRDAHLGVPALQGSLAGQLSPGSYKALFEALLRGTWTAGATTTGMTDSTLAVNGTTGIITFGSASRNFLSLGFKQGDVGRITGVTGGTVLNGINLRATSVAANAITFAPNPLITAGIGWTTGQTGIGLAVVGKKLFTPLMSSQVDRSFSIEEWQPETALSTLSRGVKPTSIALNTAVNGWTNFQASLIGKNQDIATAQIYPSAVAQSASLGVKGASGAVSYQGADLSYVTSFNIQLTAAAKPVPAIGSVDGAPAIFMGMIGMRSSIQMLATNDTMTSDFLNEPEIQIALHLPSTGAANSDFISIFLPRARLYSSARQDSDRALMRSFNIGSLQQLGGGAGTQWDNTTVVIQDSLA